MARGIILAMEEYEDGGLDDGQEVDGAELASATVETNDGAAEINNEVSDVESAADDADTVGEIRDQMEESVEEGEGMDETSAEIAEVAIEALATRLGYPHYGRVLPAKESFGGRTSRIQATRLAIEKADNIFKRAWDAIVKTVKKIIAKVIDWFHKLFDNTKKLQKAAEKMKVDYGDKPLAPAFESSTITKMQGVENIDGIIAFIEHHSSAINGDMKNLASEAKNVMKSVKEIYKKYSKKDDKKNNRQDIQNEVIQALKKLADIVGGLGNDKYQNGFLLWGNKSIKVTMHIVDDDAKLSKKGASGAMASVQINDLSKNETREGNKISVKAWPSSDGKRLKAANEKLASGIRVFTKESRSLEDFQKEALSFIDDLIALSENAKKGSKDKEGDKEFELVTSVARKAIVDVTKVLSTVNTTVLASASNTVSGVFTLNSENAKCWSKK